MKVKLLTGTTYNLSQEIERKRLRNRIYALRRNNKSKELQNISNQLVKSNDEDINTFVKKLLNLLPSPQLSKKEEKTMILPEIIENEYLFPRSEYYTRFNGTTIFDMKDPEYYGAYHRSARNRFHHKSSKTEKTQFISPYLEKPEKSNSFHVHTGGIASPFSKEKYKNFITMSKIAPMLSDQVRDSLIEYKRIIAKEITDSFVNHAGKNETQLKEKGVFKVRPIVSYQNGYPCIMVQLDFLNSPQGEYWKSHPKPMQCLLMASLIAILNIEALTG